MDFYFVINQGKMSKNQVESLTRTQIVERFGDQYWENTLPMAVWEQKMKRHLMDVPIIQRRNIGEAIKFLIKYGQDWPSDVRAPEGIKLLSEEMTKDCYAKHEADKIQKDLSNFYSKQDNRLTFLGGDFNTDEINKCYESRTKAIASVKFTKKIEVCKNYLENVYEGKTDALESYYDAPQNKETKLIASPGRRTCMIPYPVVALTQATDTFRASCSSIGFSPSYEHEQTLSQTCYVVLPFANGNDSAVLDNVLMLAKTLIIGNFDMRNISSRGTDAVLFVGKEHMTTRIRNYYNLNRKISPNAILEPCNDMIRQSNHAWELCYNNAIFLENCNVYKRVRSNIHSIKAINPEYKYQDDCNYRTIYHLCYVEKSSSNSHTIKNGLRLTDNFILLIQLSHQNRNNFGMYDLTTWCVNLLDNLNLILTLNTIEDKKTKSVALSACHNNLCDTCFSQMVFNMDLVTQGVSKTNANWYGLKSFAGICYCKHNRDAFGKQLAGLLTVDYIPTYMNPNVVDYFGQLRETLQPDVINDYCMLIITTNQRAKMDVTTLLEINPACRDKGRAYLTPVQGTSYMESETEQDIYRLVTTNYLERGTLTEVYSPALICGNPTCLNMLAVQIGIPKVAFVTNIPGTSMDIDCNLVCNARHHLSSYAEWRFMIGRKAKKVCDKTKKVIDGLHDDFVIPNTYTGDLSLFSYTSIQERRMALFIRENVALLFGLSKGIGLNLSLAKFLAMHPSVKRMTWIHTIEEINNMIRAGKATTIKDLSDKLELQIVVTRNKTRIVIGTRTNKADILILALSDRITIELDDVTGIKGRAEGQKFYSTRQLCDKIHDQINTVVINKTANIVVFGLPDNLQKINQGSVGSSIRFRLAADLNCWAIIAPHCLIMHLLLTNKLFKDVISTQSKTDFEEENNNTNDSCISNNNMPFRGKLETKIISSSKWRQGKVCIFDYMILQNASETQTQDFEITQNRNNNNKIEAIASSSLGAETQQMVTSNPTLSKYLEKFPELMDMVCLLYGKDAASKLNSSMNQDSGEEESDESLASDDSQSSSDEDSWSRSMTSEDTSGDESISQAKDNQWLRKGNDGGEATTKRKSTKMSKHERKEIKRDKQKETSLSNRKDDRNNKYVLEMNSRGDDRLKPSGDVQKKNFIKNEIYRKYNLRAIARETTKVTQMLISSIDKLKGLDKITPEYAAALAMSGMNFENVKLQQLKTSGNMIDDNFYRIYITDTEDDRSKETIQASYRFMCEKFPELTKAGLKNFDLEWALTTSASLLDKLVTLPPSQKHKVAASRCRQSLYVLLIHSQCILDASIPNRILFAISSIRRSSTDYSISKLIDAYTAARESFSSHDGDTMDKRRKNMSLNTSLTMTLLEAICDTQSISKSILRIEDLIEILLDVSTPEQQKEIEAVETSQTSIDDDQGEVDPKEQIALLLHIKTLMGKGFSLAKSNAIVNILEDSVATIYRAIWLLHNCLINSTSADFNMILKNTKETNKDQDIVSQNMFASVTVGPITGIIKDVELRTMNNDTMKVSNRKLLRFGRPSGYNTRVGVITNKANEVIRNCNKYQTLFDKIEELMQGRTTLIVDAANIISTTVVTSNQLDNLITMFKLANTQVITVVKTYNKKMDTFTDTIKFETMDTHDDEVMLALSVINNGMILTNDSMSEFSARIRFCTVHGNTTMRVNQSCYGTSENCQFVLPLLNNATILSFGTRWLKATPHHFHHDILEQIEFQAAKIGGNAIKTKICLTPEEITYIRLAGLREYRVSGFSNSGPFVGRREKVYVGSYIELYWNLRQVHTMRVYGPKINVLITLINSNLVTRDMLLSSNRVMSTNVVLLNDRIVVETEDGPTPNDQFELLLLPGSKSTIHCRNDSVRCANSRTTMNTNDIISKFSKVNRSHDYRVIISEKLAQMQLCLIVDGNGVSVSGITKEALLKLQITMDQIARDTNSHIAERTSNLTFSEDTARLNIAGLSSTERHNSWECEHDMLPDPVLRQKIMRSEVANPNGFMYWIMNGIIVDDINQENQRWIKTKSTHDLAVKTYLAEKAEPGMSLSPAHFVITKEPIDHAVCLSDIANIVHKAIAIAYSSDINIDMRAFNEQHIEVTNVSEETNKSFKRFILPRARYHLQKVMQSFCDFIKSAYKDSSHTSILQLAFVDVVEEKNILANIPELTAKVEMAGALVIIVASLIRDECIGTFTAKISYSYMPGPIIALHMARWLTGASEQTMVRLSDTEPTDSYVEESMERTFEIIMQMHQIAQEMYPSKSQENELAKIEAEIDSRFADVNMLLGLFGPAFNALNIDPNPFAIRMVTGTCPEMRAYAEPSIIIGSVIEARDSLSSGRAPVGCFKCHGKLWCHLVLDSLVAYLSDAINETMLVKKQRFDRFYGVIYLHYQETIKDIFQNHAIACYGITGFSEYINATHSSVKEAKETYIKNIYKQIEDLMVTTTVYDLRGEDRPVQVAFVNKYPSKLRESSKDSIEAHMLNKIATKWRILNKNGFHIEILNSTTKKWLQEGCSANLIRTNAICEYAKRENKMLQGQIRAICMSTVEFSKGVQIKHIVGRHDDTNKTIIFTGDKVENTSRIIRNDTDMSVQHHVNVARPGFNMFMPSGRSCDVIKIYEAAKGKETIRSNKLETIIDSFDCTRTVYKMTGRCKRTFDDMLINNTVANIYNVVVTDDDIKRFTCQLQYLLYICSENTVIINADTIGAVISRVAGTIKLIVSPEVKIFCSDKLLINKIKNNITIAGTEEHERRAILVDIDPDTATTLNEANFSRNDAAKANSISEFLQSSTSEILNLGVRISGVMNTQPRTIQHSETESKSGTSETNNKSGSKNSFINFLSSIFVAIYTVFLLLVGLLIWVASKGSKMLNKLIGVTEDIEQDAYLHPLR
eukprot:GHVN01002348.1.p1 GENE.GHVN01002348.1~~GHVN01002348.1.p1  ORF type:complete len:2888 (-),score=67.58 GHVN01002348.1:1989-10652(-)